MRSSKHLLWAGAMLVAGGCTSAGTMPAASGTHVNLSGKNYRVIKANAVGESSGFELLGWIPFAAPRYTEAMTELYASAGQSEGSATALTNVSQERSEAYFILFSITRLTVRADMIEFLE